MATRKKIPLIHETATLLISAAKTVSHAFSFTHSGADVSVVGSGTEQFIFPAATDTLVGRVSADTLTNKTLTSPKLNEDVAVTATASQLNEVTDGSETTLHSHAGGDGDMFASVYDPLVVVGDAFDMDNMAEGITTKILTAAERTKITSVETDAKDDQTASEVPIVDAGSIITATEVEGALQENRTAIDLNTDKVSYTDGTKVGGIETGADVTDAVNIASSIVGVAEKTTPVAADTLALIDSADSNALKEVTISSLAEVVNQTTPSTHTPGSGTTATLNIDTSHVHDLTMPTGNVILAVSNETDGDMFTLRILQDSVGSRTVTWFSTIKWAGGSAPTLTTTASKADTFVFRCTGTDTYDGFVVGSDI